MKMKEINLQSPCRNLYAKLYGAPIRVPYHVPSRPFGQQLHAFHMTIGTTLAACLLNNLTVNHWMPPTVPFCVPQHNVALYTGDPGTNSVGLEPYVQTGLMMKAFKSCNVAAQLQY